MLQYCNVQYIMQYCTVLSYRYVEASGQINVQASRTRARRRHSGSGSPLALGLAASGRDKLNSTQKV